MSSDKFRRDLQKRAAAKAKQTQQAAPVKVKAPAKKVPMWQGCLAIALVGLVVCGLIFALVYKVQIEPAFQTVNSTIDAYLPTIEADRIIGRLAAACFGYTTLTSTRCDEKAQAAWNEDEPTVRICVGAYDEMTTGGKYMLECVVEKGLWD